jgi:hypothetical protein
LANLLPMPIKSSTLSKISDASSAKVLTELQR